VLSAVSADAVACRVAPQRPLKTIAKVVNDVFIPRGINVPALDRKRKWEFTPVAGLKLGDHVTGGDVFGVRVPTAGAHRPPHPPGTISMQSCPLGCLERARVTLDGP
jgi:hypothetical protein